MNRFRLWLIGFTTLAVLVFAPNTIAQQVKVLSGTDSIMTSFSSGINNAGDVVWGKSINRKSHFYLYSASSGTSILLDDLGAQRNSVPHINDRGDVAWEACFSDIGCRVLLYTASTGKTTIISANIGLFSRIDLNNRGEVVWQTNSGNVAQIHMYSPDIGERKISNGNNDRYPRINDNGEVVWQGGVPGQYKIFSYVAGVVNQVSSNTVYGANPPKINNRGDVLFSSSYLVSSKDVCWGGGWFGEIRCFTMNTYKHELNLGSVNGGMPVTLATQPLKYGHFYSTDLNNNGLVVYTHYTDGTDGTDGTSKMFRYDAVTGENVELVTGIVNVSPKINDNGDIVWARALDGNQQLVLTHAEDASITPISNDLFASCSGYSINDKKSITWGQITTHPVDGTLRCVVYLYTHNTPPVAVDDFAATDTLDYLVVDVLANDADSDGDVMTVTAVTDGANGTVLNNEDGTVTYTRNAGFNGTDSFTYTVSDGTDTAIATVNVQITPDLILGEGVTIGPGTTISPSAVIGDNVTIGAGGSIGDGVVIGTGSTIGDGAVIGNDVTLGANVMAGDNLIVGSNSTVQKNTVVGNDVVLGERVTIGKDNSVGDYTTIGDGAVIQKDSIIGSNVTIGDKVIIKKATEVPDGSTL